MWSYCNNLLFQDSRIVVEKYKSGLQPPDDIPFEDLSNGNYPQNNTPRGSLSQRDTPSVKGTVGKGKKSRGGIIGSLFGPSKVS